MFDAKLLFLNLRVILEEDAQLVCKCDGFKFGSSMCECVPLKRPQKKSHARDFH